MDTSYRKLSWCVCGQKFSPQYLYSCSTLLYSEETEIELSHEQAWSSFCFPTDWVGDAVVWWLCLLVVCDSRGAPDRLFVQRLLRQVLLGLRRYLLSYSLEAYKIGMGRDNFRSIPFTHAALAVVHGVPVLFMVLGFIRQRSLVFYPWSDPLNKHVKAVRKAVKNHVAEMKTQTRYRESSSVRRSTMLMLRRATKAIVNKHSVVGVKGRYFYVVFVFREAIETAFQTVQAIRMSQYLSRAYLNRFYTCLLVINCWSSVLVHSRAFGQDSARRRFVAIVCDCALDLMSAVGVSSMIVLSYAGQYDIELGSFGFELLQDDAWIARMLSEARLVVVTSWSDLIGRAVFSLGVLAATYNMKELLAWTPRRGQRIVSMHNIGPDTEPLRLVGSLRLQVIDKRSHPGKLQKNSVLNSREDADLVPQHTKVVSGLPCTERVLLRAMHIALFALGVSMIILHVQASLKTPLVECTPKVKPMAGAHPACFAVEFDCHKLGISGTKADVEAEWSKFDHSTVVKLHIMHCSALEMPELLQEFRQLRVLDLQFDYYHLECVRCHNQFSLPRPRSVLPSPQQCHGRPPPTGTPVVRFPSSTDADIFLQN